MHGVLTNGSSGPIGWRAWLLPALGVVALVVPALTPGAARAETTWLCKPGLSENPCESSEETTVQFGDGSSSVEHPLLASNPSIDCFYVYPTVSGQSTVNSNRVIEPEEQQVAIDQASRFSQQCKVYAPMYPQLTVHAIQHPEEITLGAQLTAYLGVQQAFQEYLTKYNGGRGFVLIGHSQGALMLKQLIKNEIDSNATLRNRLVSAILLGGNVLVPKGGTVGGDFQNVPACQSAGQTHCVVAYSSFLNAPPEGANFGRVSSPLLGAATAEQEAKDEVLCVNPALATQSAVAGPLLRYEATTAIPGFPFPVPSAPTPWVSMPEQYTGQCEHTGGASWLQLRDVGPHEDPRETVAEVLGPTWGTHLNDVNIALGNLVNMTGQQAATYAVEQLPPETPAPPQPPAPPVSSLLPVSPPLASPSPTTPRPAAPRKKCKMTVKRRHGTRKQQAACHKTPARKHKRPRHKRKRPAH